MATVRFCAVCKRQISGARAEAIPETRLCEVHAEQIKELGGEFTVIAERERTSKSGSLKLNYSGVSTTQTRNDRAMEDLIDRYEAQALRR